MFADFLKKQSPNPGSIIIAALYGGLGEYSGVYAGEQGIITLVNGHTPQLMDMEQFCRLHSTTFNSEIYMAYALFKRCPISFPEAAQRALHTLSNNSYKTMLMNSHQYCSGCITGNYDNEDVQLHELKRTIKQSYPKRHYWHKLHQ